jgi:hypothetical protein
MACMADVQTWPPRRQRDLQRKKDIYDRYSSGEQVKDLADEFGIGRARVYAIIREYQRILRRRAKAAQEWTTKPPTEPGWYWVYAAPSYAPEDAVLEPVYVEGDEIFDAEFSLDGVGLLLNDKTRWLGPLPVPEPPVIDTDTDKS